SSSDLHEGNGGDRAEPLEIERDVERVGVEANRHVEREAGGDSDAGSRCGYEGDETGGRIDRPAGGRWRAVQRDRYAAGNRLGNDAYPCLRAGGVALHQLECFGAGVTSADRLISGGGDLRRQAGLVIGPILEAKAMQSAVARLEEGDHCGQIVGATDTVGDIITAARAGPAGVALLVARGELHDLRATLRSAARATRNVVRKPDLVERHVRVSEPAPAERHGA